MDNARRDYPTLAYCDSAVGAATDADVVLHLTEWTEFRVMHPSTLSDVVRQRRIVDGRNALDRDLWTREGWVHRALGRPRSDALGDGFLRQVPDQRGGNWDATGSVGDPGVLVVGQDGDLVG
jgi:hypothetical protein